MLFVQLNTEDIVCSTCGEILCEKCHCCINKNINIGLQYVTIPHILNNIHHENQKINIAFLTNNATVSDTSNTVVLPVAQIAVPKIVVPQNENISKTLLQNAHTVCSLARIGNVGVKYIIAEMELQRANKNLLLVYKQFSHLKIAQLRGHIFEALHAATFNINATLGGSSLRAYQTSRFPKFSKHIADVLISTKNATTNFGTALANAPKNMLVQLKAGITSTRAIMNPKYNNGMQKISEMACKCKSVSQTIKYGKVSSNVITTSHLTKITTGLINAEKVAIVSRGSILLKASKSVLSKGMIYLAIGETVIRNGYYVCTGDQCLTGAVKEIALDLCFYNDAKAIYNWYNGSKKQLTIKNNYAPLNQNDTTSKFDIEPKFYTSSNHYTFDGVFRTPDFSSPTQKFTYFGSANRHNLQWHQLGLSNNMCFNFDTFKPMTLFDLQMAQLTRNTGNNYLGTNFLSQHNRQNFVTYRPMTIFDLQMAQLNHDLPNNYLNTNFNKFNSIHAQEPEPIMKAPTKAQIPVQTQSNTFTKHCVGAGQQIISSTLISITNKLVRCQPLDKREIIEATLSGATVYAGSVVGTQLLGNIAKNLITCSSATSASIGAGIGTGVAIAVVDLAITAYNKGGIMKLEKKDIALATGKGLIGGAAGCVAEMIVSSGLSAVGTFCTGGCLGAVVNTTFALYAMYETRTLKDYDMNKWTWKSVGSAAIKGGISTGVCLTVVSLVAATNWWNPLGWILGIGAAVAVGCALTYTEEKCSDNWGQRKKHMDHCCEILGCSDTITKEQFASVIRRNRAKFHPDKTQSDNTDRLKDIQECIDAYCMLRKWDPENLFTDKDTISKSWSRKLFKKFYDAIIERFRAISVLKIFCSVKENKCFVNQLIIYDQNEKIPDFASVIPGGEEFDKTTTKKLRVVYIKDEYKHFAMTSFNVTLNSKEELQNISYKTDSNMKPIRSVLILDYKPKNENFAKIISKISTTSWLVGLTDDNEDVLNDIAENHEASIADEID